MAIHHFTFSQAAKYATQNGYPCTPADIRAAVDRGELTTSQIVIRGLLAVDVMVWLEAHALKHASKRP